jgi:ABC-type polysaccharide transport system permease subunit
VFVSIWAHMGFYTLILLAGCRRSGELYEAAEMDQRLAVAALLAHHAAAADAEPVVVLVLGADPRRAGIR